MRVPKFRGARRPKIQYSPPFPRSRIRGLSKTWGVAGYARTDVKNKAQRLRSGPQGLDSQTNLDVCRSEYSIIYIYFRMDPSTSNSNMNGDNPTGKMKAYRVHKGSTEIHLDEVDIPALGAQDVLIKVRAIGLATGVFTLLKAGLLAFPPFTLGHEISGEVCAIGPAVEGISVGARVRLNPNISCRSCKFCLCGKDQICPEAGIIGFQYFGRPGRSSLYEHYHDGGLSEYIRAPYWLVDRLPDNVSFEIAAKIHDLSTAFSTMKAAQIQPGATLMVTAATGAIGTAIVKLAPFFGISRLVLVARSTERLKAVRDLSVIACDAVGLDQLPKNWSETHALARRLKEMLPEGADAWIDLIGSGPNAWQAFSGLAVNGTYVHLGGNTNPLPVSPLVLMVNCWKIVGIRNHGRVDDAFVLDRLQDGTLNVEELITHRWKFDDLQEAVTQLQGRTAPIWFGVIVI